MQNEAEAEILHVYGSSLVTYPEAELNDLGIETTTTNFLHTYGLPPLLTDGTELVITITKRLTPFTHLKGSNLFYVFGTSEFGQWTLEQKTGGIYLIDNDQSAHFINSHIKYLIMFCILYHKIHIEHPYITESYNIYKQRAAALRRAFSRYDKRAVQESMVWSFKLEEVRNGVV